MLSFTTTTIVISLSVQELCVKVEVAQAPGLPPPPPPHPPPPHPLMSLTVSADVEQTVNRAQAVVTVCPSYVNPTSEDIIKLYIFIIIISSSDRDRDSLPAPFRTPSPKSCCDRLPPCVDFVWHAVRD